MIPAEKSGSAADRTDIERQEEILLKSPARAQKGRKVIKEKGWNQRKTK